MKKVLMLMAAAAMLAACGSEGDKKAAQKPADETVVVKTVVAEALTVDLLETYTSEILPYKENDITPAAQGLHIDKISVDVGDKVYAGQVVAVLDQTTLKQQELQLATTQDNYDRMKPVHASGGISDQQMTKLQSAMVSS